MTQIVKINNWRINIKISDNKEGTQIAVPYLIGEVNNIDFKSDMIHWLDNRNKIAMSEKTIYELGEPNFEWTAYIRNSGLTLDNFDIKGTEH